MTDRQNNQVHYVRAVGLVLGTDQRTQFVTRFRMGMRCSSSPAAV
jgi:hypothetical protein